MSEMSFDQELAFEILRQIRWSTQTILKRIVYNTCEEHIPVLTDVVNKMIDALQQ